MRVPKQKEKLVVQKGWKDTRPKWIQWIDRLLLIGLILIVLQAQIHGHFIANVTKETCQGVVTNCKGDEQICQAIIQETKRLITQQPSQATPYNQMEKYQSLNDLLSKE